MGTGYLLDSNVIIGYLAGQLPEPGTEAVSGIIDAAPRISVISQIEILRFTDTPENERILEDFVNAAIIHPLTEPVVHRTIALCKQSRIKLPDAIIASTALTENFVLVTRNTSDLKNIPNLELLNPWEIKEEKANKD
ncbi:MAG: type II toxin-antitoxin system VapC family toxin [Spirochaetales bacterium]|jgi:predicted nucleic acid-binding protein|nr:type II toxin-antitoxin system VapC family toxin [Spirochaetales bacterium]